MAAPESVNIKNLQGKWVMNKTLSDNFDPVLALQGIGWLTRKALGAATVTQHLTQGVAEDGTSAQIDIDQLVTGGLKGNSERRTLDWQPREHTDWLFGTLQGKTRYNTLAQITEENKGKGVTEDDAKYLVEGWLKETEDGEVVESFVDNVGNKWTGWQIWGFADVDGKRMLTRKFAIRKTDKNEVVRVRLVYEYIGQLE